MNNRGEEEQQGQEEEVLKALSKRLEEHDNNRRVVQEELHDFCSLLRKQIDDMEESINTKLEILFIQEEDRLQKMFNELKESMSKGKDANAGALQKAKAELFIVKKYSLTKTDREAFLSVENECQEEWLGFKKPEELKIISTSPATISIEFSPMLNPDEERIFSGNGIESEVVYKALISKGDNNNPFDKEYILQRGVTKNSFKLIPDVLETDTTYTIKVKGVFRNEESEWSKGVNFTSLKFGDDLAWKECPENVNAKNRYSIGEDNPRIVANTLNDNCTAIGNISLSTGKTFSWNIKILQSKWNDGRYTYIGVAPSDINQNSPFNHMECGWYFYCFNSTLTSGPPHKYWNRKYGPRKEDGDYVKTGGTVGIIMNTAKGDLSFVLDGNNLGVAYKGIPLDKPLVPCVILRYQGDSVELNL